MTTVSTPEQPPAVASDPTERSAVPVSVAMSLSPSRASDFQSCPLKYRFRVIDRLPEPPSGVATRGTVVHAVLERLFDLSPVDRTIEAAVDLLPTAWDAVLAEDPELASLLDPDDESGLPSFLADSDALLRRYFELEDPRRLEPAERELHVAVTLESGLTLRGYVDRLDVAADGAMRVVDYKTGRAPTAGFEAGAMFQMRFYALVLWRMRGTVPRLLQLLYLGSGEVLTYEPDEADLLATERKVGALWQAIRRATDAGDWRPRTSKLCDWCSYKADLCPAWGGTPPPLPSVIPLDGEEEIEEPSPRGFGDTGP